MEKRQSAFTKLPFCLNSLTFYHIFSIFTFPIF